MKTLKSINLFATALILFGTLVSHGQPLSRQWVQRYNGPGDGYDYMGQMVIDNSGNMYVCGSSSGSGTQTDIVVIKYNSSGVQQWAQRYNGPANSVDELTGGIAVDNSGNVYVAGYSCRAGGGYAQDYIVIKYNSSGSQQWASRYNGPVDSYDVIHGLAVDNSGNVYVTGESTSSTLSDYFTIKYNSNGDTVWTRRWDGGDNAGPNDFGRAIYVDASGNVYVTGNGTIYPGDGVIVTIKYNSAGVQQWVKMHNQPTGGEDGYDITVDISGNCYVLGKISNGTSDDYITIKMNSSGDTSWVRTYNGTGNAADRAYSMALDPAGNVYVTGRSRNASNFDWATVKYNTAGSQQWVQRYNGAANGDDESYSIVLDNLNNVYIAGFSNEGSPTNNDATVIKYNSSGTQQWIIKYDTLNGAGYASTVAVDAQSNVYIAAAQPFNNVYHDMFVLKYAQLVGVQPVTTETPAEFSLSQNYPNPFNPVTNIEFAIPKAGFVKLTVFDILGKEIQTLVNENLTPGVYRADWNASAYTSGMYFYKITSGSFAETKKMVLIK